MKSSIVIVGMVMVVMTSCSSPENRARDKADTGQNMVVNDSIAKDSTETGVVNATGSMTDGNNSGVNSTTGTTPKKTE